MWEEAGVCVGATSTSLSTAIPVSPQKTPCQWVEYLPYTQQTLASPQQPRPGRPRRLVWGEGAGVQRVGTPGGDGNVRCVWRMGGGRRGGL